MAELRQWVVRFAGETEHPLLAGNRPTFTLESGAEQLSPWFEDVQVFSYEDSLVVTETEALIAYIQSVTVQSGLEGDINTEVFAFVADEITRGEASTSPNRAVCSPPESDSFGILKWPDQGRQPDGGAQDNDQHRCVQQ